MLSSAVAHMCSDHPSAPVFAVGANGNAQTIMRRPRRRAVRNPLPPSAGRTLAQKIQVADEHWQELIDASNKRLVEPSTENDLIMFSALACFIHAIADDKNLCGQFLKDFDKQIRKEKSRSSEVLS